MNRGHLKVAFLMSMTIGNIPAPSPTPTPVPFWKSKSEIYRRMTEERATIVSAKTEKVNDQKKLTLITAGIIHCPESFTNQQVMDFGKYASYVPYIEESTFDKITQNVFVHGAFLGYHVRMTIHVKSIDTKTGHQMSWETVSGGFVGMKGVIDENKTDFEHTEISMTSSYQGKTMAIPDFILNWGLELAGQRASNAMRSHIESEWEKSKKH